MLNYSVVTRSCFVLKRIFRSNNLAKFLIKKPQQKECEFVGRYIYRYSLHAADINVIVIPQICNQKTLIKQELLFPQYYPSNCPMLCPTPPLVVQTSGVKQIATIQSALKPNTASTVPVSSVSPVGSVGTELPWLASASLLLETQPP